jgi:RHS repeat-associated protein
MSDRKSLFCTLTLLGLLLTVAHDAHAVGMPKAGAISAGTVKLPDGPASVAGLSDKASVEVFTAQVSYSLPLDLPQASGGFVPSLALTYSGDLGNGPMGIGWGTPQMAVRRTQRHGVPNYTSADELELLGISGGGRLIQIADGTFRAEGQGHAIKIVRLARGFEIKDAAGTTYRLGTTPETRQEGAGGTFAWMVDTITDLGGQVIKFQYQHHQGQLYMERVTWGPSDVFSAVFLYDDRPDVTTSYRTGARVLTAKRLGEVRVTSFGAQLKSYHLTYDDSFRVSRVRSITQRGLRGIDSLPTLTFEYAQPEAPHLVELAGTRGWTLNERGVSIADVDGDGMGDLLRLEMGNHEYKRNLGGVFADERPLGGSATDAELEDSRLLDLDGDARPELVRIVNDTWRAYRQVGEGWQTLGEWTGTEGLALGSADTVLVDVNGDGRTDVVRGTAAGLLVTMSGPQGMRRTFVAPRISAMDSEVEPGQSNVRFQDANGDGLADVVWLTDSWMKIFAGRGDGTFEVQSRVAYPWGTGAFDVGDLQLVDLDRDGLMDVVRFDAGHVLWYAGLPDGRLEWTPRALARPEATSADVVATVTDANGNGSQDIVWSSPAGMWLLDLAGATSAGMLVGIDNGLGRRTTVRYAASAHLSLAAESAGDPWSRKLPASIPVPVSVEIEPGAGAPRRVVHYDVRDGFWDGVERRFGGFLVARQRTLGQDTSDLRIDETRFHAGLGPERVLRGKPFYASVMDGRGRLMTTSETLWEARWLQALSGYPLAFRALPREEKTFQYEGQVSPIVTQKSYLYDDYARPVEETQLGRIDRVGDETITTRTFGHDDRTWVRDKVCLESVLTGERTLVSSTRTFYGDESAVLSACQIGKGWARRTEGLLRDPTGDRWIRLTETSYDARGNPVATYKDGISRSLGYDVRQLRPVSESVVAAAGSPALTWALEWDDTLGQPTRLTDPNGLVTQVSYDSLGRPLAISNAGFPAHLNYVYDWTTTPPRTTTFQFDGKPEELVAFAGTWTPGSRWRQTVAVYNGAGEDLYSATRLDASRWIVGGWKERDAKGRVVYAGDAVEWAQALLPTARPTGMLGQTLRYDALDRLVEQTLPNGAKKSVAYAALQQTVRSDGLEPVTSYADGLERVVRTERTVSGIVESVDATYDAAGRILKMSLQGGKVAHTFAYDSLGRLVSAYDPDIGARSMTYFDEGWLKTHTNGANQTVVYGYDLIGRITRGELHRWNGVSVDPAVEELFEYHYDVAKDLTTGCRTRGRLAWVAEPAGNAEFCYDAFGRQAKVTRRIDGMSAWQSVAYSASGLALSTTFDDGFSTTAAYDAAGRPLSLRDNGGELWRVDAQDAAGRLQDETYGNGATQHYDRDTLGLATHISITRPTTLSKYYDVDIQRNAYSAITNVSDRDNQGLNHDASFSYDGAGRLTRALLDGGKPKPYEFTYQYDGLQNMLSRTATGPRELGVLTGAYRYGEKSRGPRQLTSILSDAPRADAPLAIYTLTSNAGTSSGDGGPARDAHLSWGGSVAVMGDGSVVLSDVCRVRKIDPAGIIRTIVGTGTCAAAIAGRRGTESPISSRAVSVGKDGKTIYISTYAQVVKLDAAGIVSVVAGTGTAGAGGDGGPATQAELSGVGVTAPAPDGSLYIADASGRRIRKVSPQGVISTLSVPEWVSALGEVSGLAIDADGKGLFLSIFWSWKVIYVPLDGVTAPTVFAGTGVQGSSGDGGAATAARLDGPGQVAVAADGTVYITEYFAHRVRRVVRSTGKISTIVGTGVAGSNGADGSPAALSQINTPNGLAVGANGTVFVAEWVGYIRRLEPEPLLRFEYDAAGRQIKQGNLELVYNGLDELIQVRETAPGTSGSASVSAPLVGHMIAYRGSSSTGDGGPAANAGIYGARGLVTMTDGSLIIAGDCRLRKIDAARIITTIAGNGTCGPSVSGTLATQQPVMALSVALGKDGKSLLIAGDNQVLRMDEAGVITVVAGTGTRGTSGNGGDARLAEIDWPRMAVEAPDGTVYFTEVGNLNGYRIRVVTPDGILYELPMPATGASLGPPASLALSQDGKALFVSYPWGYRVVRLELNGLAMPTATVWAGTGAASSTGDGDLATRASLDLPGDIELGSDGSLYIAELGGRRIRQVLPGSAGGPGLMTTVVGNGAWANPARGPEGGRATDYTLNMPSAIAIDARGSVYLADEVLFQFERNTVVVTHTYGYDGLRTSTRGRDGRVQYWFTPDLRQWEENGVVKREHYVRLGDRTIARVTKVGTRADTTVAGAIDWTPPWRGVDPDLVRSTFEWGLLGAGLLLLAYLLAFDLARRRARRWLPSTAALVLIAFSGGACGLFLPTGETTADVWASGGTLYFHQGIAAGPVLMTREDGTVFEERRYEPFGQPIDAYKEPIGGTPSVGVVNFETEPLNTLNKETDPNTGWSYHGARWMGPEHGRWLTPDPPVKAPDAKFMWAPWGLHPYQHVQQNPVAYWDPDGRAAIYIAFPDYKIETSVGKLPYLGHAGVLLIDSKTGATRYYEYGRYDKAELGQVRTFSVPNVRIQKNGMVDMNSLNNVLRVISKKTGHGGRIEGAYVRNSDFKEMKAHADDKLADNTNTSREPYSIWTNNCATFAKKVIEAGGASMPSMTDPRPNSYVDEAQDEYPDVRYDPNSDTTTMDITSFIQIKSTNSTTKTDSKKKVHSEP